MSGADHVAMADTLRQLQSQQGGRKSDRPTVVLGLVQAYRLARAEQDKAFMAPGSQYDPTVPERAHGKCAGLMEALGIVLGTDGADTLAWLNGLPE